MPTSQSHKINKFILVTAMTSAVNTAVISKTPSLTFVPGLSSVGRKGTLGRTITPSSLDTILGRKKIKLTDESSMITDASNENYDWDEEPMPFEDPALAMERMNWPKSLAFTLNVEPPTLWRSDHRPLVIGHRGSVYHELENTAVGFERSADIGCDGVELDVFLLKCGTLVVFHGGGTDENSGCLLDYCGIRGNILDYTAEEARKLKFNPYHAEFGCPTERLVSDDAFIPTLKEVLEVAKKTGIMVKIELKGPGTAVPVLQMVESMNMVDQCHFSSFEHERIKRIRELRPEKNMDGTFRYITGALFSDLPEKFIEIASSAGASEVHLKYDTCTKEGIMAIHEAGMDSMAWFRGPVGMKEDVREKYHDVGNEDEMMYQVLISTGVQALCVNRPDVLVGMLGGRIRSEQMESLSYEARIVE